MHGLAAQSRTCGGDGGLGKSGGGFGCGKLGRGGGSGEAEGQKWQQLFPSVSRKCASPPPRSSRRTAQLIPVSVCQEPSTHGLAAQSRASGGGGWLGGGFGGLGGGFGGEIGGDGGDEGGGIMPRC